MKNNISLNSEIIKRLSLFELKYCEEKNINLISYFLKENFTKIFGKESLDADEFDLTTAKKDGYEVLELKTIFDDSTYTICLYNFGEYASRIELLGNENHNCFMIEIRENTITNLLHANENNIEKKYVYSLDYDDLKYSYESGLLRGKTYFSGELTCINAKHKNRELFEFTRKYPPVERSESFLRRVVETLKGEGYINVITSEELCDVVDYSDRVFDKLKEKEQEVLSPSKSLKLENED